MVMSSDKLGIEISEPEKAIEEFRQKIIYSLQKEKEKLREAVNKDAKIILSKAYQESAAMTSQSQTEAKNIIEKAKEQADRDADRIIVQAKQKAEDMLHESEETIRREAKEKTRKEIDTLIRNAKDDANKQSFSIIKVAKDDASKLIAKANLDAQTIRQSAIDTQQKADAELASAQKKTADAVEKALIAARKTAAEQAEKEAEEILTQARSKAQKEREFVLANTVAEGKKTAEAEKEKIIEKAQQEADEIVMAAKEKVRIQIEESTRLMLDIQQRMHAVMGTSVEAKPKSRTSETNKIAASAPIAHEEKPTRLPEKTYQPANDPPPKASNVIFNEEKQTYEGRLRIDIAPPTDSEQIGGLEKYLVKNSDLRVIAKGGAEDGSAWIELEISKPTALLEILKQTPSVKDVVGAKSYIIVALKAKQLV